MPVFSEITIEFLVDFEEDYELAIAYKEAGVITGDQFTWVVTRAAPFEVTTGTPTGTAGETTAINFEAAYDLDNPTNFITTQTSNSITIQSEVEGFDFVGFRGSDETGAPLGVGVGFDVTFNNYVPPIDNSNIEFALVRSPHYVNIPFDFETTTSASLDLFVWDGDLATVPVTPTYSLTFPRPSTNFAEFNVTLSKLIEEQIDATPTIDLTSNVQIVDSTADSVKWVKYTASYTDPTETITNIEGTFTAVDGYGFYSEGINPTKPTDNILTNCLNRKVDRNGFILFPFINNGAITSIDITRPDIAVENVVVTASNESTDIIQYLEIDVSVDTSTEYITITTQPAGDSVVYEIINECRYTPIQVVFKNKYGVYDSLTLFKKSNISTSTDSDKFINNYVNAGTYDITKHQYQKLNVTAKKTIKANTGYIKESENTLYEELLYSDKVWFYQNDALIPVVVKKSSLEFKTRVNDKLINYDIDFEYAYDIIQNV